MHPEGFKAVILDMDGVITQTASLHARAWQQMFDEFLERRGDRPGEDHRPFDIDRDYRQYVDGKPRYDGVRSFLESRGIDLPGGDPADPPGAETVCGLGNRKNALFHERLQCEGAQVYDDTVEQIANWKRDGLQVAVISSSRNAEAVLRSAGLLDLFDARVDGDDLDRLDIPGKPAPDMFLQAAAQLGAEPHETIIVEDAISGIEGGRAGGFGLVVGVARNGPTNELRRAGADRVVQNLRELQTPEQDSHQPDCLPSPRSALDEFDAIAGRLQGHDLALFLDYDGTLTPIVRRPEEATLSAEMRSVLQELARHCTVAIVSGRDRRDVEQMVQLDKLFYAGSHGFDIRGPGGLEMQQPDARQALPELDAAERELREYLGGICGSRVERKRFAIAIHYREVANDQDVHRVERAVDEVRRQHTSLRKRAGKKIFELQPDVEWDKGRAVFWLAEAIPHSDSDLLLIYIGDDVTDEDAFQALRYRGAGIGIRVAEPTSGTHAAWYLRDCDEVRRFLESLLNIFTS